MIISPVTFSYANLLNRFCSRNPIGIPVFDQPAQDIQAGDDHTYAATTESKFVGLTRLHQKKLENRGIFREFSPIPHETPYSLPAFQIPKDQTAVKMGSNGVVSIGAERHIDGFTG
jgi:hypothetical protein